MTAAIRPAECRRHDTGVMLQVYLFDDGLVRFATEKYSNSACTLKKRCMHLTNYSVNKKKEAFVDAKEGEDGVGFKWSFDPLKK